ncbi:hypothetical protein LSPH24S_09230 [Lysinibacillus sphaericus]
MFTIEQASLIVVDVQGKLATIVEDSETVIQNVAKLVQAMDALDVPVLWLEQNPSRLGGTALEIAQHLQGHRLPKWLLVLVRSKPLSMQLKQVVVPNLS